MRHGSCSDDVPLGCYLLLEQQQQQPSPLEAVGKGNLPEAEDLREPAADQHQVDLKLSMGDTIRSRMRRWWTGHRHRAPTEDHASHRSMPEHVSIPAGRAVAAVTGDAALSTWHGRAERDGREKATAAKRKASTLPAEAEEKKKRTKERIRFGVRKVLMFHQRPSLSLKTVLENLLVHWARSIPLSSISLSLLLAGLTLTRKGERPEARERRQQNVSEYPSLPFSPPLPPSAGMNSIFHFSTGVRENGRDLFVEPFSSRWLISSSSFSLPLWTARPSYPDWSRIRP